MKPSDNRLGFPTSTVPLQHELVQAKPSKQNIFACTEWTTLGREPDQIVNSRASWLEQVSLRRGLRRKLLLGRMKVLVQQKLARHVSLSLAMVLAFDVCRESRMPGQAHHSDLTDPMDLEASDTPHRASDFLRDTPIQCCKCKQLWL